jgi:ATP-dependent Clp protease ATP-binding subunit ClpC
MLKKEIQLAEKQGLELIVTEPARDWLLSQNDQPEFGARPLRRIISRYLREPLADFLLQQAGPASHKVKIDVESGGLKFSVEA